MTFTLRMIMRQCDSVPANQAHTGLQFTVFNPTVVYYISANFSAFDCYQPMFTDEIYIILLNVVVKW
jgi:hypothetical protein